MLTTDDLFKLQNGTLNLDKDNPDPYGLKAKIAEAEKKRAEGIESDSARPKSEEAPASADPIPKPASTKSYTNWHADIGPSLSELIRYSHKVPIMRTTTKTIGELKIRLVLDHIMTYAYSNKGKFWISAASIARDIQGGIISELDVKRSKAILKNSGIIVDTGRKSRTAKIWQVVILEIPDDEDF